LVQKIDSITFQIASEIELLGSCAVAIPSNTPYEYWDNSRRHGQGILSLKHAAVRAGLGKMESNTPLINEHLGNMLSLGAVLVDQKLIPDPVAIYHACIPDCHICLDSCPAKALDGTTINQQKCRNIYGTATEGGDFIYSCNLCRKICPNNQGIKQVSTF